MKTSRKVLLSTLLGAVCALAVVVWAEANSTRMFGSADLREARESMRAAMERADRMSKNGEKDIIRPFERDLRMVQNAYVTAEFCGVAIVILSMLNIVAIWVPPEREELNQLPLQTPTSVRPAAGAPSAPPSGAAGR